MGTIKFDKLDELNKLIDKIYLDMNKKYTKKELLQIIFELGIQDYNALLKKIGNTTTSDSKNLRIQFIDNFSGSISASNPDEIKSKIIWEKKIED